MSGWFLWLAYVSLVGCLLCSLLIAADILSGRRHQMAVMNLVWPITALYLGPLAIWGHRKTRKSSLHEGEHHGADGVGNRGRPFWLTIFVAATHCGAGCTLGDIIGEWVVFAFGASLAGSVLLADYAVDFTLAYVLGLAFQFWSIVPMRELSVGEGVREALKADTLTLVAFEIGLFGWMALVHHLFFDSPPEPTQAVYWFMMQLGMIAGLITSYPANWLVVRLGIKPAM